MNNGECSEGESLILILYGAVIMSAMAGIGAAVVLLLKNQHPLSAFLAAFIGGAVSWGFFIPAKRAIRKQTAREAARVRVDAKAEEEFQQLLAASASAK